jgi:beta-galactosidase
MMRFMCRFIAGLTLVLAMGAAPNVARAERQIASLDQDWRFMKGDAPGAQTPNYSTQGWAAVSLPHSYDGEDVEAGRGSYRGPGWYRRDITLDKPKGDQKVYLEFDGAALIAEAWLNGFPIGRHDGGFARFRLDVTDAIRPGVNILAVRTDNALHDSVIPLGGDFTVFGGLYRSVRLVTVRDLHVDMLDDGGPGVYADASNIHPESAQLHWRVRVANDRGRAAPTKVVVRLYDADHKLIRTAATTVTVPAHSTTPVDMAMQLDQPHLWKGLKAPYLYQSRIEIDDANGEETDSVSVPVGVRDFSMDPNRGFLLNGQPYAIHGVDIHPSQRPGQGPAVGEAEMDEDFGILLDLGVTGLRLVHNQHPQRTYDLADRSGVLLWTEIPLNSVTNGSDGLLENTRQQLRELIKQNYNHPSVITWGLGNELYKSDAASERLLSEMQKTAHAEDPTRPTTYAHCCGPANAPQASHSDIIAFNVYYGWYDGEFSDLSPWAAKSHSLIPGKPMAISEYGAGASIKQQEDPPRRPVAKSHWHPEQYQALYHEAAWRQIRDLPYLWASFAWVGFDVPADGRDEGDHAGFNDKGLVTYDRRARKDAYYWYQANWSSKPMLHITSARDTQRTDAHVSVKVYSNLSRIRLTLNGIDQGEQPVSDHIALWPDIVLAPGANHIAAAASAPGEAPLAEAVDWTLVPAKASP